MREIELTPKAEEDLEAIRNYSFRQFGVVQADEYIGRIAAVFDVLAMHEIGTQRAELGANIFSLPSTWSILCHQMLWSPSSVFSASPSTQPDMSPGDKHAAP